VPFGDIHNNIHITSLPVKVNGHYSFGFGCNFGFNFRRVNVKRIGVNIHKHRHSANNANGLRRRHKRECHRYNLIPRTHIERPQSQV
jgi:hypothetical protein